MTHTILFRRIVAVVAVALALGAIAGPASARTFYFNSTARSFSSRSLRGSPPPRPAAAAWNGAISQSAQAPPRSC